MGPDAIRLLVAPGSTEGTYRFVCPVCLDRVEKRADRKIVAILVSAGVPVATAEPRSRSQPADQEPLFEAPAGVGWPPLEQRPGGPPFTLDDVIEFHFQLRDDRLLNEFLAGR